jgi:hypothetical protein
VGLSLPWAAAMQGVICGLWVCLFTFIIFWKGVIFPVIREPLWLSPTLGCLSDHDRCYSFASGVFGELDGRAFAIVGDHDVLEDGKDSIWRRPWFAVPVQTGRYTANTGGTGGRRYRFAPVHTCRIQII